MRRVVVTGLGAITPLGVGVRQSWTRLLKGECGIVSVRERSAEFAALPSTVAAVVPHGRKIDGGWNADDWLPSNDQRRISGFAQYAIAAAEEALLDAGWKPETEEDQISTGVCIGSGIGNFEDVYNTSVAYHEGGYKKVSPHFVPRLLINLAAGQISMKYNLKGPNHSATTACTTGAHSLGDAARFISTGAALVMLAGGAESCIHPLAMAGFARARSLSTHSNHLPHLASQPFDTQRSGFVIGEGAGVVVLEDYKHARGRGAHIYAELVGYGCSADAHHVTAPRADGDGAFRAMRAALREAGVGPGAVDYVNAHATGTVLGDVAEARAIRRLLVGEGGWDREGQVAVSSSKGAIGHLLGAAGAVEAVFTVLALSEGVVPPSVGLEHVGLAKGEGAEFNFVLGGGEEREVDVALTNSFGFGGTNACLCFRRVK
ncbi:MAG: Mitochondrial beta-keto-acyl synthase [Trizodia sp. TS-e1964]|nr:MAG: Mitochondrial beta-keto-acyl synthase [Trizodia sp. TS-e1964]